MEKDKLFEILNEWNYWYKDFPKTFKRETYENEIAEKSLSNEVIVLKGVRRCGKSTLLINEIKRLIDNNIDIKNILFVNFEDQRFRLFKPETLLQDIKDVYLEYINPSGKVYIMLDEVQNIPAWEKWVLKEYELSDNQIYVTGSNSHLLSSEFGSALGGRYLDIEVFPLSFKEYLEFSEIKTEPKSLFINNKLKIKQAFNKFMEFGGFPKILFFEDENLKKETLKSYYDSILLKDIVARYKLKNYQTLNELALFLLSNNSTINSYNRLKNIFNTSFETIRDYLEYLENAYIVFTVNKFDYSYKKQIANPKKIYAIDVGFSNQVSFKLSAKYGQNLENIVFLEIRRKYKNIYYYKTLTGLKIDFLINKNDSFELIQVCKTLEDEKTFRRELRAFKVAQKELGKDIIAKVITLDTSQEIEYDNVKIQIINLLDWIRNI